MNIRLRRLAATDLEAAHGLSTEAGWPHRLEDWRLFHEFGSGIAACDENGTIIGTAMGWRYGARAGTLGMILVSPPLQGQGLGRRLMQNLLDDAGGRGLMLNATAAGLRLYTACGFGIVGAIRQFQGQCRSIHDTTAARALQPNDRAALLALDEAAFGAPRTALLERLMQNGRTMVIGAPQITGFAIRRAFGRGQVIGPLVATSEGGAIELVAALAVPGFLRIDIPVTATRLMAWLTDAGLVDAGGATTMVRGGWPASSSRTRRFALVSQALG